ncbi:MAG TPA: hypothetical protein VIR31_07205 [Nitrososphaeraceae archaeon]
MIPPIITKWLIISGICVVCLISGFVKGIDYQQTKDQAAAVTKIVYVEKKNTELQKVADKAGEKTQEKQENTKIIYKTLIQKEIEYVKNDPTSSTVLPIGFVRNYNAASRYCDLAEPTCQSISEPTGTITLADLIHQYNEASGLYQTCKIALDGYEGFYQELRDKHNKGDVNENN